MSQKIIRNAIILAAGFGLRMIPINSELPKALLEVDEIPLIERLIDQLHEADIFDITVVVGYQSEKLSYLNQKYGVDLVFNSEFASKNNLYSLSLVADRISNTYILPCDVWIKRNIFKDPLEYSSYFMYEQSQSVTVVDKNYWSKMTGVAYLTGEIGRTLKEKLVTCVTQSSYQDAYWEEVLYDNDDFLLKPVEVISSEIIQINTFEDLRSLDGESNHLKSEVIDIICSSLEVTKDSIVNIQALKKGMTNRSFTFVCNGIKYIMRIPGEGTDQLINRQEEAAVYNVLSGYQICDELIYINPSNGYKITVFLENARTCDPENINDVRECMIRLREIHNLNLQVDHEFNLFEEIQFYESLWNGATSIYPTYDLIKKRVLQLRDFVESNVTQKVLSHIDAVPDNFLMIEANNSKDIRLIDWEYAGMQDPHIDIAMFCLYSLYNQEQIDQLIAIYFDGKVSENIKIKIYAYIAIAGLLWSNWCEYKRLLGVDFGEYAEAQYRYADTYSELVEEMLLKKIG